MGEDTQRTAHAATAVDKPSRTTRPSRVDTGTAFFSRARSGPRRTDALLGKSVRAKRSGARGGSDAHGDDTDAEEGEGGGGEYVYGVVIDVGVQREDDGARSGVKMVLISRGDKRAWYRRDSCEPISGCSSTGENGNSAGAPQGPELTFAHTPLRKVLSASDIEEVCLFGVHEEDHPSLVRALAKASFASPTPASASMDLANTIACSALSAARIASPLQVPFFDMLPSRKPLSMSVFATPCGRHIAIGGRNWRRYAREQDLIVGQSISVIFELESKMFFLYPRFDVAPKSLHIQRMTDAEARAAAAAVGAAMGSPLARTPRELMREFTPPARPAQRKALAGSAVVGAGFEIPAAMTLQDAMARRDAPGPSKAECRPRSEHEEQQKLEHQHRQQQMLMQKQKQKQQEQLVQQQHPMQAVGAKPICHFTKGVVSIREYLAVVPPTAIRDFTQMFVFMVQGYEESLMELSQEAQATTLLIPSTMPLKAVEPVTVTVESFEVTETGAPLPGSQEFAEVIRARLQLARESRLELYEERQIRVDYHPLLRCASYLIPYQKYKATQRMQKQWAAGMRVKAFWNDINNEDGEGNWFVGRIFEVSPCDPERYPNSPWNSLVVSWNGGNRENMTRISPWQVEPVDESEDIELLTSQSTKGAGRQHQQQSAPAAPPVNDNSSSKKNNAKNNGNARRIHQSSAAQQQRAASTPPPPPPPPAAAPRGKQHGSAAGFNLSTRAFLSNPQVLRAMAAAASMPTTSSPGGAGAGAAGLSSTKKTSAVLKPMYTYTSTASGEQLTPLTASSQLVFPRKAKDVNAKACTNTDPTVYNDALCTICSQSGVDIRCIGTCYRSFHSDCLRKAGVRVPSLPPKTQLIAGVANVNWRCDNCREQRYTCLMCGKEGVDGVDLQKCTMGRCGLRFHLECVPRRYWRRSTTKRDGKTVSFSTTFACPAHFCSLCNMSGDALRMVRCFGCKLHAFHVAKCEPEGILELQKDDSGFVTSRILCPACVVARPDLNFQAYGTTDREAAVAIEAGFLDGAKRSKRRTDLLACGRFTFGSIEQLAVVKESYVSYSPPRVKVLGGEHGKAYYYFGAHDKGGGCDWVLTDVKNKLHTRIKIDHMGVVTMEYALNTPKPLTFLNGEPLPVKCDHGLVDGDVFTIGGTTFLYRFDPKKDGVPASVLEDDGDLAKTLGTSNAAAAAAAAAGAQSTPRRRARASAAGPSSSGARIDDDDDDDDVVVHDDDDMVHVLPGEQPASAHGTEVDEKRDEDMVVVVEDHDDAADDGQDEDVIIVLDDDGYDDADMWAGTATVADDQAARGVGTAGASGAALVDNADKDGRQLRRISPRRKRGVDRDSGASTDSPKYARIDTIS